MLRYDYQVKNMKNTRISKNTTKKVIKYKKNNKVVALKKKKRRFRILLFSFFCFCVIIIVILFLTLNTFSIKNIEFIGNKNISIIELKDKENIVLGKNIALASYEKFKKEIYKIPYVEDVVFQLKLPDKVNVLITEKEAKFFLYNDGYIILDKHGTVLKIDNNKREDLIEILGIEIKDDLKPSDKIEMDKIHKDILLEFTDLFLKNTSNLNPYKLDVTNVSDLVLYVDNIEIKMGDLYNIKNKLNSAFTIIDEFDLVEKSGYIDVSNFNKPIFDCK